MGKDTIRRAASLAPGLAVVLFAAACGSGIASAGKTNLTFTPLMAPVSKRVVDRDKALGKRALLVQSDFSGEYVAASGEPPNVSHRATDLLGKAVAACPRLHASVLAHRNPATVSEEVSEVGEPLHPKGNIDIESTITVLPGERAAREWFTLVAQPEMPACLGATVRDEILEESPGFSKPGNSVGPAEVSELAFPRYGDRITAYRLVYPITAEGQTLSVHLDYALARVGRADVLLTFERVSAPVWASMEHRLTALTVRRLRRALDH
jgi:hypothetical protein